MTTATAELPTAKRVKVMTRIKDEEASKLAHKPIFKSIWSGRWRWAAKCPAPKILFQEIGGEKRKEERPCNGASNLIGGHPDPSKGEFECSKRSCRHLFIASLEPEGRRAAEKEMAKWG